MDYNIIIVTIIFIAFDIVTGLVASRINGDYKSEIMREGGKHKIMLLLAIVFGVILDYSQTVVDLGISVPAAKLICVYISLMEIMSCLENINKGFPNALPKTLTSMLASASQAAGVKEDDSNE